MECEEGAGAGAGGCEQSGHELRESWRKAETVGPIDQLGELNSEKSVADAVWWPFLEMPDIWVVASQVPKLKAEKH